MTGFLLSPGEEPDSVLRQHDFSKQKVLDGLNNHNTIAEETEAYRKR